MKLICLYIEEDGEGCLLAVMLMVSQCVTDDEMVELSVAYECDEYYVYYSMIDMN